jgi:uncharacterized protein YfaS (alpha-2-macroglobulin family)
MPMSDHQARIQNGAGTKRLLLPLRFAKRRKGDRKQNVSFTGQGTYTFIPRSSGDYEIRIYQPGATAYVSKAFYSYGSWGSDAASFDVNTEGAVDIELDKEKYKTGERAKLLFKTPF